MRWPGLALGCALVGTAVRLVVLVSEASFFVGMLASVFTMGLDLP
jgi:hypothetical protein